MFSAIQKLNASLYCILRQRPQALPCITRTMNTTSYDYDGKTKVSILNNDFELGLLINSYSEVNFE